MKLFDSHMHFDRFDEAGETEALLERARAAGVTRYLAVGGSPTANRRAQRLAESYAGSVFASAGYDRDLAGRPVNFDEVTELLTRPEVVAVGETGLDYHYSADSAPQQRALFQAMLEAAAQSAKPVIIHSREAEADTLALLDDYVKELGPSRDRPAVLHCFTGDRAFAEALVERGLWISFSGILTFANAEKIREAARIVPDDRILIETDAPFLAPTPHRGKRNEPAFVIEIARMLAELRETTLEEMATLTTANAECLFGITTTDTDVPSDGA